MILDFIVSYMIVFAIGFIFGYLIRNKEKELKK